VFVMPDNTRLLSGHGPDTTVGEEKISNQFVGGE
jgi:hydroxyacylglutathione hydrolase